MHKAGKITCLDGHVGVGKTSLVNVAAHECFRSFLSGSSTQLLIPMQEAFQLTRDETANEFCAKVFRRVAQTLLDHRAALQNFYGHTGIAEKIAPWLNSPIIEHLNIALGASGSIGVPAVMSGGVSATGSTASQINTGAGFNEHGFEQLVRTWLDAIFSNQASGGVICVIDNLELLETGTNARRTMEALRDRLFTVNGLRWVFCGANGVIHSLAASPRLSSFLSTPVIDVGHIAPAAIKPLFDARTKEFSIDPSKSAELPITIDDLRRLYLIVNFNLRDLLATADSYCEHLHVSGISLIDYEHKARRFDKWLEKETAHRYQSLSSRLPTETLAILDIAMSDDYQGSFGIGDHSGFNSNSKVAIAQSTFAKKLRDLIKTGLLSKAFDDDVGVDDGYRRDVYSVTAKGALVHYARLTRHETLGVKPVTWLRRVT